MVAKKKKCNWRIRGKRCYLEVYFGSDFKGNPVRYNSSISNINPKTGKPLSDKQRDKAWWDFYKKCETGNVPRSSAFTINQMCQDVLERKIRPSKSPTTYQSYRTALKRINATIGENKASSLSKRATQDWVNFLSEEYKDPKAAYSTKEKGLASKTVRNTLSFLSRCFDVYIQWELLNKNPCQGTELPKSNKRKEQRSLTLTEVRTFTSALEKIEDKNLDYKVAYLLALCCGLRESEICGIENEHLNIDEGTIRIIQSSHFVNGERYTEETKTISSAATVYVPEELLAEIKKLQKVHDQKRDFFGDNWENTPALIKSARGGYMYNRNLWGWLNKFLKQEGLEHFGVHALRHTYISMLHSLGQDIVEISHQARHANKSTTLNVYSHLFESAKEMKKRNATRISETVFPTNSRQRHKITAET